MKNLVISFACLCLLAACGSESKPSAGAQGSGQTSGLSGACPNFNGTYSRKETTNGADGTIEERTESVKLATKGENGAYLYDFSGNGRFLTADGQVHRIEAEGQEGEVQVSCDANSVTVVLKQEEQPATTLKYTAVGENQVKVESSDEERSGLRGTYTKE